MVSLRAIFDDIAKLAAGLKALKDAGMRDFEAYGPTNLKMLQDFMPTRGSTVRLWSYAGAVIGLASFFYMCAKSSLIYSIVTGGKPPVSNVPFLIVSYEGTILVGSLATFLAVLVLMRLWPRKPGKDYDPRFSGTDFGIVVRVRHEDRHRATDILRQSGAMEVNLLD